MKKLILLCFVFLLCSCQVDYNNFERNKFLKNEYSVQDEDIYFIDYKTHIIRTDSKILLVTTAIQLSGSTEKHLIVDDQKIVFTK